MRIQRKYLFYLLFIFVTFLICAFYIYNSIVVQNCGFWDSSFNESKCQCKTAEYFPASGSCHTDLSAIFQGLKQYAEVYGGGHSYPPHNGEGFMLCLLGKSNNKLGCPDLSLHSNKYAMQKDAPLDVSVFMRHSGDANIRVWRGPKDYRKSKLLLNHVDDIRKINVIACEEYGYHGDYGHVLYENGSIRFLCGNDYKMALSVTEK
jgi:hypothetical protein